MSRSHPPERLHPNQLAHGTLRWPITQRNPSLQAKKEPYVLELSSWQMEQSEMPKSNPLAAWSAWIAHPWNWCERGVTSRQQLTEARLRRAFPSFFSGNY